MKIRKANQSDIEQILDLLKELKVSGYTEMGRDSTDVVIGSNSSELCKEVIDDNSSLVLVVEENDKLVALAVCYLLPKIFDGEKRLLIEEFVVTESKRGSGLGSLLLDTVETEAKKLGVKTVKLTTGTKLKANKFYQKHGYRHFENAYRKKLE